MEKSSEKENKKVQTDKQFEDNEVREGKKNNSIYNEDNNKSAYPYKSDKDEQFKNQPEFIDRNAETKNKT